MADVANELIFEVFKQVQSDISQLTGDMRDIKLRATGTEEGIAGVNRRLDRIDDRLDGLERRVGLVDH